MPAVKDTPAARVRAALGPAIRLPPKPPRGDRESAIRGLTLSVPGRELLIGPNIEGDPALRATINGTATLTIAVRDRDLALQDALADEASLLEQGVTVTLNGIVYALQSASVDDTGLLVTLTFEDLVSWRLRQFHRFLRANRANTTRAEFVGRMVIEASSPPLASMKAYIPELTDKQRIAKPDTAVQVGAGPGTGASITSPLNRTFPRHSLADAAGHTRLTPGQVVGIAEAVGFTHRVAVQMTEVTKGESSFYPGIVGHDPGGTLGYGLTQITTPPANGPDLVRKVESLGGWDQMLNPFKNLIVAKWMYDQRGLQPWVGTEFLGTLGDVKAADVSAPGSSSSAGSVTEIEPYEFTRGDRNGQREDSWAAVGRLATEVNFRYWAELNTLFYVSDEELRNSEAMLRVDGGEGWLLAPPSWDWAPGRPVTEVSMKVLAERWGVQIGACVILDTGGPCRGRFLVTATDGTAVGPELTVTLQRPTAIRPEPPPTTRDVAISSAGDLVGGQALAGGSSSLLAVCREISQQDRAYLYGGGHGKPLASIGAHESLDCSSAVSLALWKAGMFSGSTAIVSGQFASSWGQAGKGREFTVYANSGHVWIEFENAGPYKRFDTSPYGSGTSGPHVRTTARGDQANFTARHWPGH